MHFWSFNSVIKKINKQLFKSKKAIIWYFPINNVYLQKYWNREKSLGSGVFFCISILYNQTGMSRYCFK